MKPKIRRRYQMPFGAELTSGGQVRFRLWAPAAQQVEVALYHAAGTRLLPMHPMPGGWFGCPRVTIGFCLAASACACVR